MTAGPPPLPASTPPEIREFVECRADRLTLADGPITWIDVPMAARLMFGSAPPTLRITRGADPASATLHVALGPVSVSAPATVRDGELRIDTTALPSWVPSSITKELVGFQDRLNAWLAANGQELGPPEFAEGSMTLVKVPAG